MSSQEVIDLYATNATTTVHDEQFVATPLPEFAKILNPQEFAACASSAENREQQQLYAASRPFWGETRFTTNHIQQISALTDRLSKCIVDFKSLELWQIAVLDAGREGGQTKEAWELLKLKIAETVQLALDCRLDVLQHAPAFNKTTPIAQQLAVVEQIVQHTTNNGKIGFWAGLTNRSWKEMSSKWSVRSGVPTEPDHFAAICKLLRLQVSREQLALLWDGLMHANGSQTFAELGDAPEDYCKQFETGIQVAINQWCSSWGTVLDEVVAIGFNWNAFLGQSQPIAGSFGILRRTVGTVENRLIPLFRSTVAALSANYQLGRLRTLSLELEKYKRSEVTSLRAAISNKNATAYETAYKAIQTATVRQREAAKRLALLAKLDREGDNRVSVAGSWASRIRSRDGIHGKAVPPGDAKKAWRWRQLNDEIIRRHETDIEQLQQQIEATSNQLDRATVELIEHRAWAKQVKQAGALQQDLVGWLDVVRRIGKGYGKRVAELQTAARLKMRNCRAAVPVWIMPISRLVDNFDFAKTQFDVVIIDEASQCDVMGLLAISLAKQVVVVGDHEQVSPSNVGQDIATVGNLIRLHLDGIPNSELYDGKMSIYDLARQSFGGLVRLVEHFRCTTDIIQFSNYLSYNGEIKPLRDDALFEHQVIEYRVESAARLRKINEAEADAITSLIVAATEFQEYDSMSFGVISLVGNEQALQIEQQLRRRLSPEVYDSRRVVCGNSAQFQGDERDVMFLSMIDTPTGGPLAMRQAADYQQRFNVAASRAKNQMWVVHSLNPDTDLQFGDLRKRLISHARDPKAVTREIEKAESRAESPFEEAVIKRLVAARFKVTPQWKVGRYRIDIVVQNGSKKLAVECDGDRFHGPEKMADDMNRQAILERLGWKFHRIRGTEFFRDPEAAMSRLFVRLQEQDIRPNADSGTESLASDQDSITQRLIRRAAEIRHDWENPDNQSSPTLFLFDPTSEPQIEAIESELIESAVSEIQTTPIDEQAFLPSSLQAEFAFHDEHSPKPIDSPSEQLRPLPLNNLDKSEAAIVNLLQRHSALGAKQIADKLNMEKKEVNRILYGRLSNHVICDENFRWRLTAS